MNFEGDLHSWRYLARERLADWKAERERRIKAEQERDEARADLAEYVQAQALHTHPRPLTPDAITDEMIQRASQAYFACTAGHYEDFRRAIVAALTEPTRPEGAEKVEAVLHQYWSGDIDGDDLADRIAEEMNR